MVFNGGPDLTLPKLLCRSGFQCSYTMPGLAKVAGRQLDTISIAKR